MVTAGYVAILAFTLRGGGTWNPLRQLPLDLGDPLQHLWIMRWYRSCLLEGRLPWFCPEVEYPVGAPIGNFSPMHLQSLLYILLSIFTNNDALIFNILVAIGFLLTGLGTYALALRVTGDRGCAFFAGVATMVSTAVQNRGCRHLELVYVGGFPLFLVAWLRFVDAPSRRRMWASVLAFWLVSASAAYYMVFTVFPAALYVVWAWGRSRRQGEAGWVRARVRWLAGFSAAVAPGILLLFSGNIWAALNDFPPVRQDSEFLEAATPLAGYVFPTIDHPLDRILPFNPYRDPTYASSKRHANVYLGVVTLLLVACAAAARARLAKASFWWLTLAMLVVLGMGAYVEVAGRRIMLPAYWLRQGFPPFRLLRDSDRFHMFVPVVASILAAAGLRRLLGPVRSRPARIAVLAAVLTLTIADVRRTYPGVDMPPMPACYEAIKRQDPQATFFELYDQPICFRLGYWQSIHRCPSTASFSGLQNIRFLSQVFFAMPMNDGHARWDQFLANGDLCEFPGLYAAHFRDYLWIFMKTRNYRYLVYHKK
jgi:hypothetical protein